MIEHKKATKEEAWNFAPIIAFLRTMAEIHGKDIDQYALLSLKGETRGNDEVEDRARRIGQALESVLLMTTEGVQSLLGSTWTNAQQQGNGQPAFESKSQLGDQGSLFLQVSRAALAPMLSLLKTCAEHCPIFLLHLPAAKDQDRNEDLLVRRAVESAVSSILDPDVDTSTSCMDYLESTLEMTTTISSSSSPSDPAATAMIRQSLEEILSKVRREMLNCILVGVCGKFGTSSNLESAAKLLHRLLGTYLTNMDEGRTSITTALSRTKNDNYFLLGARAQSVVTECLFKTCQNQVTVEQLEDFVEHIWDLHHSDSAPALAESDSVGRFCQRYSSF
jgi:hypothetical protein